MRLLICAGGTGGGVNPALAVHEALKAETSAMDVLWVGGEGGMEAQLVKRTGLPYRAIPAAGLHGVGLRQLPGNLARLMRGVGASRKILKEFKPDVLFFTGGYLAVPMALAGMRIPSMLYVPDIEPGLALRTLAWFADRIALTAEASRQFFHGRTRLDVTGYPVRPELNAWPRAKARQTLGIKPGSPVVLISGGSKGARSINQAVTANLPALLDLAEVIHITGELDWPQMEAHKKELNAARKARWHVYPYLYEEMGAALSAADLAVTRAGASTLGELPLFGLPAILVPYPYAWRYQKVNAETLVGKGAAVLLEDARLQAEILPLIRSLLADPTRLKSMRTAMQALSQPEAARRIAGHLLELANERR